MDIDLQDEAVSSSTSSDSSMPSSSDLSFLNDCESSSESSISVEDFFDFSSEDEITTSNKPVRRDRVCIKNYCETVVPEYSDEEFILQFRLDRSTVNKLIIRYSESKYCVILNRKF